MILATLVGGCRFAAGLVFALSCATKLRDPRGFARGLAAYRMLPARLTAPAAAAVIAAEAAVALAMLSGVALLAGALAAVVLGGCFAAAVGVNLARRAPIRCHCFGAGERISGRVLARIAALLAAAAAVLAGLLAGLDLTPPLWSLASAVRLAIGAAAVAVTAWVLPRLWPAPPPGAAGTSPAGPQPGAAAPDFTAPRADADQPFELAALRGTPVLLAVVAIGCGDCAAAMPLLRATAHRQGQQLVLVCVGPAAACRAYLTTEPAGGPAPIVVTDLAGQVVRAYGASAIPHVVAIDAAGRIAGYGTGPDGDGGWGFAGTPPVPHPAPARPRDASQLEGSR
jgi:hypothetical protein